MLFADLQGFTTFSDHQPGEVARMLNEYFSVAVPAVVRQYRGDVDRIIGDALMVTFNKRGDQPDHAHRAAGAGLALQAATSRIAQDHRDGHDSASGSIQDLSRSACWVPRRRTHTIVGDTVNTASRIEGRAPAGAGDRAGNEGIVARRGDDAVGGADAEGTRRAC